MAQERLTVQNLIYNIAIRIFAPLNVDQGHEKYFIVFGCIV